MGNVEAAIKDLEDALRMASLEMVGEADPRACDGKTHASPAHMVGYMAAAILLALKELQS